MIFLNKFNKEQFFFLYNKKNEKGWKVKNIPLKWWNFLEMLKNVVFS